MLLCLMALARPVLAQGQAPPAQQPAPSQQQPDPDQPPTFEETVVVSASRVEQQLVNAPAAVSVISTQTIENSPATNIGDLLRAVPGVNVSQVSARDINITARGATSTLSTSQLALVDGRSIYLDFYGMVMWDFVPANPHEIKQIEVIRGPASAVWGANAMSGVVNVITKSPRELAAERGTSLTIGAGGFVAQRAGSGPRRRLAVLRERLARTGRGRPLGLQAVGRLLHPGPAAAPGRHHQQRAEHTVSAVHQHRHVAAQVRYPGGLHPDQRRCG